LAFRKKILVVDDNPSVTYSIEKGLKSLPSAYEVTVANNGSDCIEHLKISIPDLILLDIMMPGMNGWDVVEKLHEKKKWSTIPIIFLTAKDDSLSKTVASLSVEDYIVKPVDLKDLDKRIKKILRMP
jgi:DNA-binding response OmpR family regulator